MSRRPNRTIHLQHYSQRRSSNLPKPRRPFWLPASNFYFLAAAIAIAFFFLLWGILHDGDEPTPWIPAGIGASCILIAAVFLREIVLRKARNRFLLAQKRLDSNLRTATAYGQAGGFQKKLTLQKNAEIIDQIRKKSEAAKVLMKLPEGHREVFEMCREYLDINKKELETVGAGSPRLAALRRGREIVREMHRFHLLAWAEIEARTLIYKAKNAAAHTEKIENAQNALTVINSALQYYPSEVQLRESEEAVREFIVSIRLSHWIDRAERATFKGNYRRAIDHYQDALYLLAQEALRNEEIDLITEKITREIEKLREISGESKIEASENENDD